MLGLGTLALTLPLVLVLAAGSPQSAQASAPPDESPSTTAPPDHAPSGAASSDAATAAPAPAAPASPTATPAPPTSGPIASPTISSPSSNDLLSNGFTVRGSAEPSSSIQVSSSTQSDPLCITTAADDGAFSCSSSGLPNGPNVVLTVVQLVSGQPNQNTSVTVNVLNPPTLSSGAAGGVSTGYGTVRGTGFPGATITASGGGYSCSYTVDGRGTWACNLGSGIPSGSITVRATQATGWSNGISPASAPLTLQIDSDSPAPPAITSPTPGSTAQTTGSAVSGTGEDGALVTVFAGSFAACTATVHGTTWSCATGSVPAGNTSVSAIQQDAAGNVSDESAPFTVTFSATATPTPTGTAPGSTTPASGSPTPAGGAPNSSGTASPPGAPTDGSTPGTPGSPSATGGSGGSGSSGGAGGGSGSGSGGTDGSGPGAAGGGAPVAPGAADSPSIWAGATRFTSALQPVLGSSPSTTLLIALLVALALILLIAAPGRLLGAGLARLRGRDETRSRGALRSTAASTAKTIRSQGTQVSRSGTSSPGTRTRVSGIPAPTLGVHPSLGRRLTGRNRARNEFDTSPELLLNPWLAAVAAVIVSAGIGMLSGPIDSQPAYLRLLLAISIAFAALNAAAVLLPRVIAQRWLGISSNASFAPRYLLVAAGVALASRLLDLEPALLFGLVFSLSVAETASRTKRAQFAVLQLTALIVCGSLAWLTLVWVPAVGSAAAAIDPVATLTNEALTTLVLGAFGAAAMLVLPFGRLLGKSLFEWSKPAWFVSAVVSFTLLAAVLVPSFEHTGRGVAAAEIVLVGIGFAAVSVSVWAWLKFIAPVLGE
ncbi:MAG: hypothetical protein JWQ64_1241 [Subtercola sp.]|nr:hypothetical protein [Subtercola sp.]